jgi:hypothetical protein
VEVGGGMAGCGIAGTNIEDLCGIQSVNIAKYLGVSVLDHHYHVKVI